MKLPSTGRFGLIGEKKENSTRWKLKRLWIGATVDTMIIGSSVVDTSHRHRARLARIASVAATTRDPAGNAGDETPLLKRRSADAAVEAPTDRRGVVPEVRSKSTQIIYDKRAVDRREITDRRRKLILSEPPSGFVAQAVAREGMLLDLRPDPLETRRARTAYEGDAADEPVHTIKRVDFTV